MNIKERLRHVASKFEKFWEISRTEVCHAAQNYDGIVLTSSLEEAAHLEKRYNVTAKCWETNLDGYAGPFFVDPWALKAMLEKAANKIESLEADNVLLELKIKRLENL